MKTTGQLKKREKIKKKLKKRQKRTNGGTLSPWLFFGGIFLGIAMIIFLGGKILIRHTKYKVDWTRDLGEGSFAGYQPLGEGLLKYSKDGAIYLDGEGKEVWNVPYQMENPMAVSNGNYAAIGDKQKNQILIFNTEKKNIGTIATTNPIGRFSISRDGVVAVMEEDSTSTYIRFYKQDGSPIEITIKNQISGEGYPTDLSLSDSGSQLLVSYAQIKDSGLSGNVAFYDFSDAGKEFDNRMICAFNEQFKDALIGRAQYMSKNSAFAISDQALVFFQQRNTKVKVKGKVDFKGKIQTLAWSKDHVALIVEDEGKNVLLVYNGNGKKVCKKVLDQSYKGLNVDDYYIFLYDGMRCQIYNYIGVKKFDGTFDFEIHDIRPSHTLERFRVAGSSMIKEISLR